MHTCLDSLDTLLLQDNETTNLKDFYLNHGSAILRKAGFRSALQFNFYELIDMLQTLSRQGNAEARELLNGIQQDGLHGS